MSVDSSIRMRSAQSRNWTRILPPEVATVFTGLGLWSLFWLVLRSDVVPAPWQLAMKLGEVFQSGLVVPAVAATLMHLAAGWGAAMALGISLGLLMGINKYVSIGLRDYVLIALSLPGLVGAIMGVIWFGASVLAGVFAVMMVGFPMVAINAFEGIRNVDKDLLEVGIVYKLNIVSKLFRIVLPSMMPFVFAAARLSFGYGWKVISLVEVFGAQPGVGHEIDVQFGFFSVSGVLAWTVVFSIVILAVENLVFSPAQNYVLRWRRDVGRI